MAIPGRELAWGASQAQRLMDEHSSLREESDWDLDGGDGEGNFAPGPPPGPDGFIPAWRGRDAGEQAKGGDDANDDGEARLCFI